jgi:hypothetical protein
MFTFKSDFIEKRSVHCLTIQISHFIHGLLSRDGNTQMNLGFRKKRSPRPVCQYSVTEAHKYFVSHGTELYLKYGCGTPSEMICWAKDAMCYVCLNHRYRIDEWQQETYPHLDIKWNSVWDLHNE